MRLKYTGACPNSQVRVIKPRQAGAWSLLLADVWMGLYHWPFAPLLARGQWALARCLRCWLLAPRLPVEMREEALDGLCVAFGTSLLADQEALARFPVLEF